MSTSGPGQWPYFVHSPPARPEYELYDLERDQEEGVNVFSHDGPVRQRLLRCMGALRADVYGGRGREAAQPCASPELLEQLKALGYL